MSHPPETTPQKGQDMLLENKNAVIYGGGGSIGGAVAREFSREGARVFLVGRTRENLETLANDIKADGGAAEVAVVGGLAARAAARRMVEQGSGVILALESGSANGSPMMGSPGPADAATDTFVRNLAAEIGPRGVRVVGIWTAGLPETFSQEKLAAVDSKFQDEGAFQGLIESLDQMRMTRRSPKLGEVAATAAFLASEKAGAITGTFVNVTSGTFPS